MNDYRRGYLAGLSHAAAIALRTAQGVSEATRGDGCSGRGVNAATEAAKAIAEAIETERGVIRAGVSGDNSGGGNGT